ncbi:SanA/YdcF family protein [Fulvivirga sediminis]|uniref:YdcF family protein n=1 Tax=Fulvivirga sediminis TaxID=2803949 RepID=A0A937FAE1_9BACT|nr:ElyC/SanA/YdcF family protein [Fulvivirga sediminis]MBL3658246.1 YdcF family protein [Fulvivirga sediminis]
MNILKSFLKVFAFLFIFLLLIVLVTNLWIYFATKDQIYTDMQDLPTEDVGLVLGTSNYLMNGDPNPFFRERMKTAAKLYKIGKIKHILVSGDNRSRYYNEPIKMRRALIKLGVPADAITLDYAGLRTLDSIVRCKKIFGQDHIIIITQSFHGLRALFISNYYDIEAVVMGADNISISMMNVKMREYLARTLAVWDLYIVKKEPKFLGEKETLNF